MVKQNKGERRTFRFAQDVDSKIRKMAEEGETTLTTVLEELVRQATVPPGDVRFLVVESTDPFIVSGDTWDDAYTGLVRVRFENFSINTVDIFVQLKTFNEFVNELCAYSDKLLGWV